MAEYIERDALIAEINLQKRSSKTSFPKQSFVVGDVLACIYNAPAADVAPVKRGCRYCSKDDCGGVKWDFEDIEVTVTLQRGVLTICNQYGDEAEMPIRYCPICGARMDGE